MTGTQAKKLLDALCERLDKRSLFVGVCALPLVLGNAGCGPSQESETTPPSDDVVELIMDGVDNDGDGLVDCEDPDCAEMDRGERAGSKEDVPMYGVPMPDEPIEPDQPIESEEDTVVPCVR